MWPWVRRSTLDCALDVASSNAATANTLRALNSQLSAQVRLLQATQDLIVPSDVTDPSPLAVKP